MTQIVGPSCCAEGIRGYGGLESQLMFIGIAPGRDEAIRTKRPLTGPSGYLLDRILESQDIPRAEVYCTNLICWWNDSPTPAEIAVCSQRLQQEIQLVNPKLIVLLGKIACESILGIPFSKARGAIIDKDGRRYLATYHPAACLHKAGNAREKEQQINIAYSLCRDMEKLQSPQTYREWPSITYDVLTTIPECQALLDSLRDLPQGTPVILDIETDYDKEWEKAHPFDSAIVCIGVGWTDNHAHVMVLAESEWTQLSWPLEIQYTYHNGPFDTQEIMRHTGVWLPIGGDTMLMSGSTDERNPGRGEPGAGLHKLKPLGREFTGADFYEEDDHKLPKLPDPVLATETERLCYQEQLEKLIGYNAKDVVHTKRLRDYMASRQDDSDRRVYQDLLLPAAKVLRDAQYRGIYVDQQALNQISVQFCTELIKLDKHFQEWARDVLHAPEFNQRSPTQVKKMMSFQGYELPDTKKATLLDLLDQEPDIEFVPKLLRYRTLDKLIGTYITGIKRQLKYDGRAHPHFYQLGTVTGRLSYQLVQTLPKSKTVQDLQIVRSIFSSTNDDYVLLEADYAQIEGWIGAYLSEDQTLWDELASGDWHTATTVNMFGKHKADVTEWEWDALRDAGKHINYGIFFNESAQGLTRRPPTGIGCDLPTAKAYLDKWKATHPKFALYQKEQMRLAKEEAYIETPFGRKRRFPIIVNDHQLNQAVNCRIQSTAGDYTISSSIRLAPLLARLDTHLLFIEHDALYYEVNRHHLQEVIQVIREEMQRPPLPGLPSIRIEIDLGPDLAHLEKLQA